MMINFDQDSFNRTIADCFFGAHQIGPAIDAIKWEHARPSVLFRPSLTMDGNMYCALYGENLQEGCAGFGETPDLAMRDFDTNWTER